MKKKYLSFLLSVTMVVGIAFSGCSQIPVNVNVNSGSGKTVDEIATGGQETSDENSKETDVATVKQTNTTYDENNPACTDSEVMELLSKMTLREKIGQMIMVAARRWSDTPDNSDSYENSYILNDKQLSAISENNLCGICLFAQNFSDTKQAVELTKQIQDASFSSDVGVGALISIDQEGGYVTRVATGTSGIGNMAIAATGKPENARKASEIIGEELDALGINLDFAPDADVNNDPNNPVIGIRSFSDDPAVVSEYVGYYLEGLKENNVIGCLKHFPGHGDTATDSHTGLPLIDKSYEEIKKNELIPFNDNHSNAEMIMTAHIQFPQIEDEKYISISTGEEVYIPATMSKNIITGILREDIGFEGVIVTDALEMDAIASNFRPEDSAKRVINAGVDILLMPVDLKSEEMINNLTDLINSIEKAVNNGEIDEAEIDDSVIRILQLKASKGLFENDKTDVNDRISKAIMTVGSKEHHDAEWNMACEAVTVYKNDGAFPLTQDEKSNILFLAPSKSQILSPDYAVSRLMEDGFDTSGLRINSVCYEDASPEDALILTDDAGMIILSTSTGALSQTDVSNPDNKEAIFCSELINRAHEKGIKVIVISSKLPYDKDFYSIADAVLMCYNPAGFSELPGKYDGTVKKFGANVPAAIYTILQ